MTSLWVHAGLSASLMVMALSAGPNEVHSSFAGAPISPGSAERVFWNPGAQLEGAPGKTPIRLAAPRVQGSEAFAPERIARAFLSD